jgi:ankyrin repeat protein
VELVNYLLDNGAHDPEYKTYPFLDKLEVLAQDRGYTEIATLLTNYAADTAKHKYKGDNGEIKYERSPGQQDFFEALKKEDVTQVEHILKKHPEFVLDDTWFWGEGVLLFAVKHNNRRLIDLLIKHGAKVPSLLKWAQFYYFERFENAQYIMEKGMDPNTMSWHRVTLLHDMAQKGYLDKTELLLKYGATIDPVDEEYASTPLGMAARWGHIEMVNYLLKQGADPNKSGDTWSTALAWAIKKDQHDIAETLRKAGAR